MIYNISLRKQNLFKLNYLYKLYKLLLSRSVFHVFAKYSIFLSLRTKKVCLRSTWDMFLFGQTSGIKTVKRYLP